MIYIQRPYSQGWVTEFRISVNFHGFDFRVYEWSFNFISFSSQFSEHKNIVLVLGLVTTLVKKKLFSLLDFGLMFLPLYQCTLIRKNK